MEISLYFCLAAVVLLTVCFMELYNLYAKLKRQHQSLRDSFANLEQLNQELRKQRHDYLNHMQIVYGMMELEDYDELRAYLEPVYKDLMKTGKALKTSIPAVNALLCAKMAEAENQGIDFFVEVKSDLSGLSMEPWELCKVLSNLIDNAMTALAEQTGEKKLRVELSENKDSYWFLVADNGPEIPKERREEIFKPGFTTKKEKGHGMGLAIVADVLRENQGSISMTSDEAETAFQVRIAKAG